MKWTAERQYDKIKYNHKKLEAEKWKRKQNYKKLTERCRKKCLKKISMRKKTSSPKLEGTLRQMLKKEVVHKMTSQIFR